MNVKIEAESKDRVKFIEEIHKNAFQSETTGKKKDKPIGKSDVVFLFGNFNLNTVGIKNSDMK